MGDLEGGAYLKTVSDSIDKRTAPSTPPVEPPELSLPEIKATHSKELGAFVENHRDPAMKDLAQRWFDGKLSGDDLTVGLPNLQKEFLAAKRTIETSAKTIAREGFELAKKNSKDFADICAANGDEVIAQTVEKGFIASGYSDPKLYGEIHAHNARIEMVRKDLSDSEKSIDEFRKKYNVSEEEFESAMKALGPAERQRALKHIIKREASSRFELWSKNWKQDAANMANMQDDFVEMVERRNLLLGDAGNFVVKLIKTDPQWQEAMNRALNDEMPQFKQGPESSKTYEGARAMKDSMSADDIVAKAEKFRTEKLAEWGSGKTWKDPKEAAYAEGEFMKQMEKEIGSGFWASLIRALFNANKNDPRIKNIFTK